MSENTALQEVEDLQPFEPIEIKDEALRAALKLVPKARDDDVRRKKTAELVVPYALLVTGATIVWYALLVTLCAAFSMLLVASLYSAAAIITIVGWNSSTKIQNRIGPGSVPSRPKDWNWREWIIGAVVFAAGPMAFVTWFVDVVRRSRAELKHASGDREFFSSEIIADDRVRDVLLQLEHHLAQWERVIIPPNRWIACVEAGFAKREDLDQRVERVRAYGLRVQQLVKLAEILLRLEGPLGNEASRDRRGEHVLFRVSRLIAELDNQLETVVVSNGQIAADVEVQLLTTEEVERKLLPAPKDNS